jgi:hypothetical protein
VQVPSAITDAPLGPLPAPEPSELPSAVVRPTPARGPYEDVFYDDGKILVCESQLIIGKRVYPLRHVVGVKRMRAEHRIEDRKVPFLRPLTALSAAAAVIAFFVGNALLEERGDLALLGLPCHAFAVLAFVGFIVAACLARKKVPMYALGLVEKGGYVEELLFRSRELRDDVFAALCEALDV